MWNSVELGKPKPIILRLREIRGFLFDRILEKCYTKNMLSECQQLLLDELSWRQSKVFLYYFILKMTPKDISKHLKLSAKYTKKTIAYLSLQLDFIPIKEEMLKAYKCQL